MSKFSEYAASSVLERGKEWIKGIIVGLPLFGYIIQHIFLGLGDINIFGSDDSYFHSRIFLSFVAFYFSFPFILFVLWHFKHTYLIDDAIYDTEESKRSYTWFMISTVTLHFIFCASFAKVFPYFDGVSLGKILFYFLSMHVVVSLPLVVYRNTGMGSLKDSLPNLWKSFRSFPIKSVKDKFHARTILVLLMFEISLFSVLFLVNPLSKSNSLYRVLSFIVILLSLIQFLILILRKKETDKIITKKIRKWLILIISGLFPLGALLLSEPLQFSINTMKESGTIGNLWGATKKNKGNIRVDNVIDSTFFEDALTIYDTNSIAKKELAFIDSSKKNLSEDKGVYVNLQIQIKPEMKKNDAKSDSSGKEEMTVKLLSQSISHTASTIDYSQSIRTKYLLKYKPIAKIIIRYTQYKGIVIFLMLLLLLILYRQRVEYSELDEFEYEEKYIKARSLPKITRTLSKIYERKDGKKLKDILTVDTFIILIILLMVPLLQPSEETVDQAKEKYWYLKGINWYYPSYVQTLVIQPSKETQAQSPVVIVNFDDERIVNAIKKVDTSVQNVGIKVDSTKDTLDKDLKKIDSTIREEEETTRTYIEKRTLQVMHENAKSDQEQLEALKEAMRIRDNKEEVGKIKSKYEPPKQ